MRPISFVLAVGCATVPLSAQANCTAGAGQPTTIATQTPFFGNSLYGHPNYPNAPGPTYTGFSFLFDITPIAAIEITRMDFDLYDDGNLVQVNSTTTVTSPNQVGATTTVEVYVIPGFSWVGNELNQAAWTLWGTGTLTVSNFHTDSPAVFSPPLVLPAGLSAVSVKIPPPTNGPNPGPLHPMLDPLTTPPVPYSDPRLTIANLQFQRESWNLVPAPASHRQNIEWHYRATNGSATWTSYGSGCAAPNDPVLALAARPIVGTTLDFQASNLVAGTLFNFWLLGFVPDPAGFPLGGFGLPGCNLYLQFGSPVSTSLSGVTAGMSSLQIPVPADPTYLGVVMFGQAAPMTSGFNAGGFLASNGVCVAFGLF